MSPRTACFSANSLRTPPSNKSSPSPSPGLCCPPAAPNPCSCEHAGYEREENKTGWAGQATSAKDARAAEDAAHLGRDETMVRDAKNRTAWLATSHVQADVWHVGYLSTQENLCCSAGHEGLQHPKLHHIQIRSHGGGPESRRPQRAPPHAGKSP